MYQNTAINYMGSQDIMESNTNQDISECSMSLDMENQEGNDHEVMDSFGGSTHQNTETYAGEDHANGESIEGDVVQEPYEGMEFESEEAARIYYNKYAMSFGFGSRISRNRRSRKDGETIARNFVCCKEGYRLRKGKDNEGRIRRNRAITREGCGAMITVKKTNLGKWAVSKFVKEHNHPLLSPNEVCALRSHREVSRTPKKSDLPDQADKEREIIEKLEGDGNLEPCEGMELESEDAARIFYSAYARQLGFRSRISKNRRSRKDGEIIARKFVCYREGYRAGNVDSKKERIYRPRAVVRQGCEAMIYVKKTETGKWVVSKFVKEHNHPMINQSKVRSLRSDGNALSTPKSSTVVSNGGRTGARETTPVVGLSNESISEQDGSNHIQNVRKRKRTLGGKDPEDVLDYLERMQSENPAFFYATKVDEDDNVHCIFWVDPRSRMAYNYFGDVVYFDTTYVTDQYEVPFTPFLGVNHHQQCTLFGGALLFDETESSFVWLFNTWLEAMSGRHPITIITNQSDVIGAAVAQVFPKSHHCFCKLHIFNQAAKQLAHVYRTHPAFKEEFLRCVSLTEEVSEFESCWESLVHRYRLRKNEWFLSLYSARQKWVPVYLRDIFFAQDSETMNSFFDRYVKANTTFQEFVAEYERALASRYEKELEEDIRTAHTKPILMTRLPFEKQAADTYTRTMFSRFQEEIYESLGYVANKIEDGSVNKYSVAKYEDQKGEYTVTYNAPERRANCSCQMFESFGILCRHALIVFTVSNVVTLPSHYILERWTRNAKSVVGLDRRGVAMQANCRKSPTLRYSVLCKQAIRCAEVGATSVQDYDVAVRALREAWEKIIALKRKAGGIVPLETPRYGSSQGDNIGLQSEADNPMRHITPCVPPQPKRRGRPPKNSSLNPSSEKPTKNARKCSLCKENGHDNSSCPRLRPIGSNFSNGGGMFVVDTGPSDLHAHAGIGEHPGFSEGILGLSLGDHFDSHINPVIPSFGHTSFFQIASLANPRHLNTNEGFSLTGARPSSEQHL
ncbi:hypothetical protein AAC387_Pa06g1563 [Persea americana]